MDSLVPFLYLASPYNIPVEPGALRVARHLGATRMARSEVAGPQCGNEIGRDRRLRTILP
jgi:hypothetical protein